ncbi:helix-turn-helix transcriptional regulator [Myroides odoratimimus]|uniref:helix-turn-helix transcriptional regulator n=1 Tax=Myroides odoratimimus TaxID=76832 RepID=UPI002DB7AB8F|nr:helix-turn-helix transcriptional regulator [Myroides odoratimimus]MEC4054125.1 helix-turn-helix transcriptional regulator [Myroides odoratimimus]
MTNKEKFIALVSPEETKTVERAKVRIAKRELHKVSQKIALHILNQLSVLGWKQKDLAEKMAVTPQQVSKWVKGNENFTIDTLIKLSEVLGFNLFEIPSFERNKVEVKEVSKVKRSAKTPSKVID